MTEPHAPYPIPVSPEKSLEAKMTELMEAQLLQVLGLNQDKILSQLVSSVLNGHVSEYGGPANSYGRQVRLLDYLAKDMIREKVKECFKKLLAQHEETIIEALKKQLMADDGAKFATALLTGSLERVMQDVDFDVKVNINVEGDN